MKLKISLCVLMLCYCNIGSAWALDIEENTANVANLYSDVDMRVRLAIKSNDDACQDEECIIVNDAFDQKVQVLGESLAATAYNTYPNLSKKISQFTFTVVNKKESGMASNAAGKIVVFRGVQYLDLSDDALSFVLAREMGHVIGRHHNKNMVTKVLFSVAASILFPAVTLLSASNVAAEATTTVVTSLASTATSLVGSEVAISKIKPNQLVDADNIAMTLLDIQGWDSKSVISALHLKDFSANGWMKDLQLTVNSLSRFVESADKSKVRHLTQVFPLATP